ncbi:hypothetical protein NIES4103_31200 [Nostoc sp. NIES-4103]|nr:hypothetical protein NIES4103_31200 [Nostoc sp. NIES-4103]
MKKVFIALLVVLLGCSANTRTRQVSAKTNKKIDFPTALALKDGVTEPAQVDVYRQEFEKLKKLCIEDDDTLTDMVYTTAKKLKKISYNLSPNLNTLKFFTQLAESEFEHKPVPCIEFYFILNPYRN